MTDTKQSKLLADFAPSDADGVPFDRIIVFLQKLPNLAACDHFHPIKFLGVERVLIVGDTSHIELSQEALRQNWLPLHLRENFIGYDQLVDSDTSGRIERRRRLDALASVLTASGTIEGEKSYGGTAGFGVWNPPESTWKPIVALVRRLMATL